MHLIQHRTSALHHLCKFNRTVEQLRRHARCACVRREHVCKVIHGRVQCKHICARVANTITHGGRSVAAARLYIYLLPRKMHNNFHARTLPPSSGSET